MRRGEREARKARLHANLRLISGGGRGGVIWDIYSSRSTFLPSFLLENKDWKHFFLLFFDNKRLDSRENLIGLIGNNFEPSLKFRVSGWSVEESDGTKGIDETMDRGYIQNRLTARSSRK